MAATAASQAALEYFELTFMLVSLYPLIDVTSLFLQSFWLTTLPTTS
jgi:hypothetical protein